MKIVFDDDREDIVIGSGKDDKKIETKEVKDEKPKKSKKTKARKARSNSK